MSLSINMVGQNLAMDGRINTNSDVVKHVTSGYTPPENVNKEAASVAEDFADLDYSDDDNGYEFSLVAELEAGKTYYYGLRFDYSSVL